MPDTLPAVDTSVDGVVVHRPVLDVNTQFHVQTSLPCVSAEHRMAILEIIEAEHDQLGDYLNVDFPLRDYVTHLIRLTNQDTGEIFDAARTILLTGTGPTLQCVSAGVLNSLGRLGWATGRMPPWEPPIMVRCVQRSIKGGRRVFKLVASKGS